MHLLLDIYWALRAYFELGGRVVVAIFLATLIMWTLIVERFFYFYRHHQGEARELRAGWEARGDRASWAAKNIRRMLVAYVESRTHAGLPVIKALVALCPLLGLLGTVTGMIQVFEVLALMGSSNARAMASGVYAAIIPTMTGLVVAILGLYLSTQLQRKADRLTQLFDESLVVHQ